MVLVIMRQKYMNTQYHLSNIFVLQLGSIPMICCDAFPSDPFQLHRKIHMHVDSRVATNNSRPLVYTMVHLPPLAIGTRQPRAQHTIHKSNDHPLKQTQIHKSPKITDHQIKINSISFSRLQTISLQ